MEFFKKLFQTFWSSNATSTGWIDGYPPRNMPKYYYDVGVYTHPDDPQKVVHCWRKNANYYADLI